jgi:hypothetical protein
MNWAMYNNIFNCCSICGILFILLATTDTEMFDLSNNMLKFVRDCNPQFFRWWLRKSFLSYPGKKPSFQSNTAYISFRDTGFIFQINYLIFVRPCTRSINLSKICGLYLWIKYMLYFTENLEFFLNWAVHNGIYFVKFPSYVLVNAFIQSVDPIAPENAVNHLLTKWHGATGNFVFCI